MAARKIGVLVEAYFDEVEHRRFDAFFPEHGLGVEYLSHLWGHSSLTFPGNERAAEITVTTELSEVDVLSYAGIILIGGYAMDRLRYEEHPRQGQPNQAPAVRFLRKAVSAMDRGHVLIGTICHSLWLFCASPDLLANRRVTCAHNILCDVASAGGVVAYERDQAADVVVDGGLVSARHPGVVDAFMETFLTELNRRRPP